MALAEDVRITGTLGAQNDTVAVSNPATAVVTAQLTGTFVGTVIFEVNNDEGASPSWVAVNATNVNTNAVVANATAPGIFKIDAAGYRQVHVKCSVYGSGTVNVTLNASVATPSPSLTGGTSTVIGDVGGFSAFPGITLTRGANTTPYTGQDEVATTSTAPTAITVSRVTGGTGFISGARLVYSNNPAVTPSFRLLLFNATLTAAGDNVALALSDADAAKYLGHIDFTATQAGGATTSDNLMMSGAPAAPIQFVTDTVFALLITTNAFTPIANSETIKIMLGTEQN